MDALSATQGAGTKATLNHQVGISLVSKGKENLQFTRAQCAHQASQVALPVKNLPANAGAVRNVGRPLGREDPLEGMATHSSIPGIPWTEEPGGLQVRTVAKSWTRPKRLSTQGKYSPI